MKTLDVVSVEPYKNNTLLLVFENNEKRLSKPAKILHVPVYDLAHAVGG
ncbi:MAG: hypothetical protein V1753_03445 [Pseudomonadota bacterium]